MRGGGVLGNIITAVFFMGRMDFGAANGEMGSGMVRDQ
jgi:hypothetical protein